MAFFEQLWHAVYSIAGPIESSTGTAISLYCTFPKLVEDTPLLNIKILHLFPVDGPGYEYISISNPGMIDGFLANRAYPAGFLSIIIFRKSIAKGVNAFQYGSSKFRLPLRVSSISTCFSLWSNGKPAPQQ